MHRLFFATHFSHAAHVGSQKSHFRRSWHSDFHWLRLTRTVSFDHARFLFADHLQCPCSYMDDDDGETKVKLVLGGFWSNVGSPTRAFNLGPWMRREGSEWSHLGPNSKEDNTSKMQQYQLQLHIPTIRDWREHFRYFVMSSLPFASCPCFCLLVVARFFYPTSDLLAFTYCQLPQTVCLFGCPRFFCVALVYNERIFAR